VGADLVAEIGVPVFRFHSSCAAEFRQNCLALLLIVIPTDFFWAD
jgi:hypothetical protein